MTVDPRVLHLKIRVILTRPMTAEQARALLDRAVRTGKVPPGIELAWIDWRKGEGAQVGAGRIDDDLREALRNFYGAITASDTRFERVQ